MDAHGCVCKSTCFDVSYRHVKQGLAYIRRGVQRCSFYRIGYARTLVGGTSDDVSRVFLSRMNEMPLIIPTLREISVVKKEDIVCFAFEEKGWRMYTVDGKNAFLSIRANKNFLLSLYDHLIVVNKSLIFNIDYISSIENNSFSCTLKTDVYSGDVKFSKREYANFVRKSKIFEK